MSWIDKIFPPRISRARKKSVPEGVWAKCRRCGEVCYSDELERNHWVCASCSHHDRITPEQRRRILFDSPDEAFPIGQGVRSTDFLGFTDTKGYPERLSGAQQGDDTREALAVHKGKVGGQTMVVAMFDFGFMGGSMGSVVGERFVLGVEEALRSLLPFVCFSASGGARMQEGLTSLFQMGKTAAAVRRLGEARLPYISVLTDPTTGGVAASLAMVGDVVIAEPGAQVGFAGPRVIQETVREILPDGFQSSEFLLEHGAVDMIVDRREMRDRICALTKVMMHARQNV